MNLLEMKQILLEDKNKIINIMLNLNIEKKEEEIISKNKYLPLKRRTDEEQKKVKILNMKILITKRRKILGMIKNIIIKFARII